jgi:CRISPR/Cas system CSM-associated protein Csm4 (group 5 of RAMP superfamily)
MIEEENTMTPDRNRRLRFEIDRNVIVSELLRAIAHYDDCQALCYELALLIEMDVDLWREQFKEREIRTIGDWLNYLREQAAAPKPWRNGANRDSFSEVLT